MKTINRHLYARLSDALKMSGSYDPDDTLHFIEEGLTIAEYRELEGFLRWCHEGGKTFGHRTYAERFAEYKRAVVA